MTPPSYPPLWAIWRNPIVRRFATARLRLFPVLAWSLVVQPLAAFLWLVVYFATRVTSDVPHRALHAWIPILILQGVIWLLKGTFSVAAGIAREGAEGLAETQRLSPLGAWHKVFGYLVGLPILESFLVFSLLPWSAVSIWLGHVPIDVVFRVHLLLITSALLHHAIGLVAGTVIRQKIVAGTVSQILVITIHLIIPLLSFFGLGAFGHLGVEKAISTELLPLLELSIPIPTVRFLSLTLSLTGYSWVVMFVLLAFLLQILRRRWEHADAHLFSKPLALAFSAWIILMSLGETIPLIQDGTLFAWTNRALDKAARRDASLPPGLTVSVITDGLIPVAWAGAFGCIALFGAMLLATIITPTPDRYRRARNGRLPGVRRMFRRPWTSDAQTAFLWTALLGLIALAGWSILVSDLLQTHLLRVALQARPQLLLILGAGLIIPLLTWALLLEWRGLKIACLGAFLCWVVPVMVASVGILSGTNPLHWPKWWLAVSGFVLPFYSMSQGVSSWVDFSGLTDQFFWPWLISLLGHSVVGAALLIALCYDRYVSRPQAAPSLPRAAS